MNDKTRPIIEVDSGDEPLSNHSDNPHFSSILEKRLSRRKVLKGSLSAAVVGVISASGISRLVNADAKFLPLAGGADPPFALN